MTSPGFSSSNEKLKCLHKPDYFPPLSFTQVTTPFPDMLFWLMPALPIENDGRGKLPCALPIK